MKKLVALVAAGLVLIAASQLVSTVQANRKTSQATIARRVAALEKKVKALQSQVKGIKGDLACENAVVGVTQYGNPPASQGYLYTPDNVNVFLTTALDVTPAGQTPRAWIPVVDASCVTAAASHYKPAHIGQRATGTTHFKLRAR